MDKRKLFILIICISLIVILFLYWLSLQDKKQPNARLEGQIFDVAPKTAGLITEVNVEEGSVVSKDFVLFNIDPAPYKAEIEKAEAILLALEQGIPLAEQNIEGGLHDWEKKVYSSRELEKNAVKNVESLSLALARASLQRRKAESYGNSSEIKKAIQKEAEIKEKLSKAKQQQDNLSTARYKAEQDLGVIKQQMREQVTPQGMQALLQRQINAQKIHLEKMRDNLENTSVRSPIDGYILNVTAQPGFEAVPGRPLLQVVPLSPDYLWLTAFFDEKTVAKLKEGQNCNIQFVTLPNLKLEGRVLSIRTAATSNMAAFTRSENSTDFGQNSNLVPVKVSLENYDPASMPQLSIGMTALVSPVLKNK